MGPKYRSSSHVDVIRILSEYLGLFTCSA